MATTTVNALPPLKAVAHAQSNELFNVMALIEAVQRDLPETVDSDANDRLLSMAIQKLGGVVAAFDPYI